VSAELAGFQKSSRNVILEIGQKGRVDFTLGSSGASETVVVDAPVRLLNTEQSSLGTVMDQGKVANLPLAIRNWDDLLALVPGVQGDRFTEQGGGTSFGRTGGSTCTARARCSRTSSSTAWTTTASRRTCRS
jgi:hypothetical protein